MKYTCDKNLSIARKKRKIDFFFFSKIFQEPKCSLTYFHVHIYGSIHKYKHSKLLKANFIQTIYAVSTTGRGQTIFTYM